MSDAEKRLREPERLSWPDCPAGTHTMYRMEDVDWALAEIARLRDYKMAADAEADRVDELTAENARLREELGELKSKARAVVGHHNINTNDVDAMNQMYALGALVREADK